jgi:integrase/recombinase XerD
MTPERVSPLRQRLVEDMTIRQFGPKTQHDYVRVVADFARFLGRSPDQAAPEDLRRYQLHLAAQGAALSPCRSPPAARLWARRPPQPP